MKHPLISICIPSFNSERYLPSTLSSIDAQSLDDYEVILVDDGSTDSSSEVFTRWLAHTGRRGRLVQHGYNRGLPAARDSAIEVAQGSLIAILDSDDVWAETHLEALASTFGRRSADVAFSDWLGFTESPQKPTLEMFFHSRVGDNQSLAEAIFSRRFTIQPSSVLFRKTWYDEKIARWSIGNVGNMCEDYNVWLRAIAADTIFHPSSQPTLYYRKHTAALTTQTVELLFAELRLVARYASNRKFSQAKRRKRIAKLTSDLVRLCYRKQPTRCLRALAIGSIAYSTASIFS